MSWRNIYPFESQFFKLPSGAQMHYIDEGPRDAQKTLLFVHGNPTWSFYYRNLVEAFSSQYRCVAMDHIGCGLSDKPTDYNYVLKQRIDDLEALVDSLELSNVILVVHDWGGAIGMGLAGRQPELMKGFVVFNTAAFRSSFIPFSINICKIPVFGEVAVRGFNGFVRVAQIRAIHDKSKLDGDVKDGYLTPYDSYDNRIAVHQFVKDIPMGPAHRSYNTLLEVENGLEQFQGHPMLIVWGDQDFCFNEGFRKEWMRRFPDAEVHALDDASHYVVEDALDRILQWMPPFVDGVRT